MPLQTEQTTESIVLSRRRKTKPHKSLIIPVLLYGAEAWTMFTSDKLASRVFERTANTSENGTMSCTSYSMTLIYDSTTNEGIAAPVTLLMVRVEEVEGFRSLGRIRQRAACVNFYSQLLLIRFQANKRCLRQLRRREKGFHYNLKIKIKKKMKLVDFL